MKFIHEIHSISELSEEPEELLNFVRDEANNCKKSGDFLGAGEWLSSGFNYVEDDELEKLYCEVTTSWASSYSLKTVPENIDKLILQIDEFDKIELSIALVSASFRLLRISKSLPIKVNDIAFRLIKNIQDIYGVKTRKPKDLFKAAAAKLETNIKGYFSSISSFLNSNCSSAKIASHEVIKAGHRLSKYVLSKEKNILNEVDILLGPNFKKFCEGFEKQKANEIIKWTPELKSQVDRTISRPQQYSNSTIWNLSIFKIAEHILLLIDEASIHSQIASTPLLKLSSNLFKIDLTTIGREMAFSGRLLNNGEGKAIDLYLESDLEKVPVGLKILKPNKPFDIAGGSNQIVTFGLTIKENIGSIIIPIRWKCSTLTGKYHTDEDKIEIYQQKFKPDWANISKNPPYTINPITKLDDLFGRDSILTQLNLNAASGTSTFLWGQKRVGKTSVLQVLKSELDKWEGFICLLFRMGELLPLHEGQIAHRIAERIYDEISSSDIEKPLEDYFGGGLSRLIPYFEKFTKKFPDFKFLIMIDEFDDIDHTFYTGERGKHFIKALRSLSEIGLTFFFSGSERMNTIYSKHTIELNKWVNIYLDILKSHDDCKNLIEKPVDNVIEYQSECINFIINYCGSNPFYMNLFCSMVFTQCLQELRTYVGESDLLKIQMEIVHALGETNFAHFWKDNPILKKGDRDKQEGENCLIFACMAKLGGEYRSIDDLVIVQEKIGLSPSEQISRMEIRKVLERLYNRRIIHKHSHEKATKIILPIFTDWLLENAEPKLLPIWRKSQNSLKVKRKEVVDNTIIIEESIFPIPEDELLSVSQNLFYCGKQKDVSELRIWLRQFDDDIRIEVVFLLLKRLAEKGFFAEGAKIQCMTKIEDAVRVKRLETGDGKWNIVRGKCENLCITHVDSITKSGLATAREFAKRLRPGKFDSPNRISNWIKSHTEKDALILIVDDFAATGNTLSKGLGNFLKNKHMKQFLDEGRILCYVLYSFPEALQKIRNDHPKVNSLSAHVFGEEVRALDKESKIYENEQEIKFAKDILIQIGRELTPQSPLGYGDMGALVTFHNSCPNNTLPIFWSNGIVNEKPWKPLFPRA